MKSKQSHSPELPDALRERLELARKNVRHHERAGNHDTYWHSELRRLERAAAEYVEGQRQTDEAGEPESDTPPQKVDESKEQKDV